MIIVALMVCQSWSWTAKSYKDSWWSTFWVADDRRQTSISSALQ